MPDTFSAVCCLCSSSIDSAADRAASNAVLALEQEGLLERRRLGPLTADQVDELASAMLDRPVPGALVDWLTGG